MGTGPQSLPVTTVVQVAGVVVGTGPVGTGPVDSGPVVAGPEDWGPVEAGPLDSGPVEAGPVEPGPVEPGPLDSGPDEAGPVGTGPVEDGVTVTVTVGGAEHSDGTPVPGRVGTPELLEAGTLDPGAPEEPGADEAADVPGPAVEAGGATEVEIGGGTGMQGSVEMSTLASYTVKRPRPPQDTELSPWQGMLHCEASTAWVAGFRKEPHQHSPDVEC